MTLEDKIKQAVARAWCHPNNSMKEMDSHLVEAIVHEVVKILPPSSAVFPDNL